MFKKFARWILANEINEAEIKLDIAKARVEECQARAIDLATEANKADDVIEAIYRATMGIKQGTAQKVYRIVSDYYKGE